jgi:hypothetical protein
LAAPILFGSFQNIFCCGIFGPAAEYLALLRNIWPLCHSAFFWKFPMVDIDEILAKAIRVPISTCPLLDKSKILKLQKMIGKHYAENR